MTAHRYQPFYCEENAWWLCQHPALSGMDRWVVFISNAARQCVLRYQRAATGGVVVWDYHVIVVARDAGGTSVWDLDCRLGMPVSLDVYLERTFPDVEDPFRPTFRVVDAATLVSRLHSDRSHMRNPDGGWLKPPPPWEPPGHPGAPNLQSFIDMQSDIAGEVMDLPELSRYFDHSR